MDLFKEEPLTPDVYFDESNTPLDNNFQLERMIYKINYICKLLEGFKFGILAGMSLSENSIPIPIRMSDTEIVIATLPCSASQSIIQLCILISELCRYIYDKSNISSRISNSYNDKVKAVIGSKEIFYTEINSYLKEIYHLASKNNLKELILSLFNCITM